MESGGQLPGFHIRARCERHGGHGMGVHGPRAGSQGKFLPFIPEGGMAQGLFHRRRIMG